MNTTHRVFHFLKNLLLNFNTHYNIRPWLRIEQSIDLPIPPSQTECYIRSFFKRTKAGLNSEFSFFYSRFLTKAKDASLPYYLPIAGEEKRWIHDFPKSISTNWSTASFKIWTRVTDSISYEHNHKINVSLFYVS